MESKVRGKNETIRVAVLPYVVRRSNLMWSVSLTLRGSSVLPYVVRRSYLTWFVSLTLRGSSVLPYVVHQSYLTWFISLTLRGSSVLPYVVRQSNPFQSFPEIKKEAKSEVNFIFCLYIKLHSTTVPYEYLHQI